MDAAGDLDRTRARFRKDLVQSVERAWVAPRPALEEIVKHETQVDLIERALALVEQGTTEMAPEPSSVPVAAYTDPERHAREVEAVFRRQPQIAAHAERARGARGLRGPGDRRPPPPPHPGRRRPRPGLPRRVPAPGGADHDRGLRSGPLVLLPVPRVDLRDGRAAPPRPPRARVPGARPPAARPRRASPRRALRLPVGGPGGRPRPRTSGPGLAGAGARTSTGSGSTRTSSRGRRRSSSTSTGSSTSTSSSRPTTSGGPTPGRSSPTSSTTAPSTTASAPTSGTSSPDGRFTLLREADPSTWGHPRPHEPLLRALPEHRDPRPPRPRERLST